MKLPLRLVVMNPPVIDLLPSDLGLGVLSNNLLPNLRSLR